MLKTPLAASAALILISTGAFAALETQPLRMELRDNRLMLSLEPQRDPGCEWFEDRVAEEMARRAAPLLDEIIRIDQSIQTGMTRLQTLKTQIERLGHLEDEITGWEAFLQRYRTTAADPASSPRVAELARVRVIELEEKIKNLREKLRNRDAERAALEQEMNTLATHIAGLENRKADLREALDELRHEIEADLRRRICGNTPTPGGTFRAPAPPVM